MKWSVIVMLLLCCACRKMETYEHAGGPMDMIDGKWKLVQYSRDNEDGSGQGLPTDTANVQTIQFTHEGEFKHNDNFVIQESIDRYKFLEPHKVLLYSSHATDSAKYYYQQDHFSELIFNPLCKEFSCMRKFSRLQ